MTNHTKRPASGMPAAARPRARDDTDPISNGADDAGVKSSMIKDLKALSAARQAGARQSGARPATTEAEASSSESSWSGDDNDGYEGDPDEMDASERAEHEALALTHIPGHLVMDRKAIKAALKASGFNGSFDHLSGGEEARVRTLIQYRDGHLFRPHLIASPAMITRLDDLGVQMPNFRAVTQHVRRAAHVSLLAEAPLRVQPHVLVGSPGIGKSRYCRALATALGTSCDIVNGSTIPDVSSLTGYPPAWKGAGPGRLAKYLMSAASSGPLILVDESDKIVDVDVGRMHPMDRLLALLEHDTAKAYQDENLNIDMAAQHAVMLFACNSLEPFSAPFLSRVIVTAIPDLDPDMRDAVLETMLGEVASTMGLRVSLADRGALAPIRSLGLRRCKLAFEIAIGHAVEGERRFLIAEDLAKAVAVLGQPDARQPIGFFPSLCKDRG